MPRESIIGVRVSDEQRGQFERAATAAGKSVSAWLRDLGAAAIAPPKAAANVFSRPGDYEVRQFAEGEKPRSYPAPAIPPRPPIPPVESPEDLARARKNAPPLPANTANTAAALPVEDYWSRKFAHWDSRGQAGEQEKAEAFQELRLPRGIWKLSEQLAWLREHYPNGA